jgi:hypothetical protein
MKFRKKPVVIDAYHLTENSFWDVVGLVNVASSLHQYKPPENNNSNWYIKIKTLEGVMKASPGDYVIKGIQGEFYPCKPDTFEQTYERVE